MPTANLILCPNCCESKLERSGDFFLCRVCGSSFSIDQMQGIEEKIEEALARGEMADLGKARNLLSRELSCDHIEIDKVLSRCDGILRILPEDPIALLLESFFRRSTHRKAYHSLLSEYQTKLNDYQKKIVYPYLIDKAEFVDKQFLLAFLSAQGDEKEFPRLEQALKRREEEIDLFANVHRDVFICHAHADMERIKPLLDRLEAEQGWKLWYSERNLADDVINYKANIEKAIASCDVFLLFLSSSSVQSNDVAWELDVADRLGKAKRLEYRIEDRPNSLRLKEFFDGLQWVDGSNGDKYDLLAKRIYDLLRPQQEIDSEEKKKAEEARRREEEAKRLEEERSLEEERQKLIERQRAEEQKRREEQRRLEEQRKLEEQRRQEEARKRVQEETRRQEEARKKAEEAKRLEEQKRRQAEREAKRLEEERSRAEYIEFTKKYQETLEAMKKGPIVESDGKTLLYGIYPQTLVTDKAIIAELTRLANGKFGKMHQLDGVFYSMRNGSPYEYRYAKKPLEQTFADGKTVIGKDYVYWFRCDPIRWVILRREGDEALILSESLLERERFNDEYFGKHERNGGYANGYATSKIREFLNTDFLKTAFPFEKNAILTTRVDNSSKSFGKLFSKYACEDVEDKVFLLSVSEVSDPNFGFVNASGLKKYATYPLRKAKPTDYALAWGAYKDSVGAGQWWLRSPDTKFCFNAMCVSSAEIGSNDVERSCICVRPAMRVSLSGQPVPFKPSQPSNKPAPSPKKKKRWIPFAAIGGGLALLGGFLGAFFGAILPASRLESEKKANEAIVAQAKTPTLSNDGKSLTYGLYPQTVVSDKWLIDSLNESATLESNGWYLFNEGYYAKITADTYSLKYKFSTGEAISRDQTYWFKCEPIEWRVLSSADSTYFVVAESLLDVMRFDFHSGNYAQSEIREWLNGAFYDSAFSLNSSNILTTTVDNSLASTGDSENQYVCEDTKDKVFLLSYSEATNPAYGFSSDSDRIAYPTDYALANCAIQYSDASGVWWLRSPYGLESRYRYAKFGGYQGYIGSTDIDYAYGSARPAMRLRIGDTLETESSASTNSSSSEPGSPIISEDGKSLTYGLYPQTVVSDAFRSAILSGLSAPESNGWYLYNGEYYAKQEGEPYGSEFQFSDGSSIYSGQTYWFKCERIKWRILSSSDDDYFVVSESLLDAHQYDGGSDYTNNYAQSEIREWLNGTFYDSAFSLNSSNILTTTVDNSLASTGNSVNQWVCEDTDDNVFLLSYSEATNPAYGFSSDSDRIAYPTDYALARGAYKNRDAGCWWLRTPHYGQLTHARGVDSVGSFSRSYVNVYTNCVRPAMRIKK